MARNKKKKSPPSSENNWGRPKDFDWANPGKQGEAVEQSTMWLDLGRAGSSSGSTSGVTNSYAIRNGDPTDPNSIQIQTQRNYHPNWPDWAKQAAQAQMPAGMASTVASQPLPTGKSLQTLAADSPELQARMKQAQEALENPQQFIDENVAELNEDQTLLDKGMSFLGGLFNYEDESDLQVFGLNISAVESGWDNVMRYLTGGRNVLDAGIGALISAMPGGIRTLEWGELTDNHSLWEVLHGDIGLKDNVAPSPMQIAMASVAVEAKRIREGNGRLSDILLANPATAPFILAGIAAESSPLQRDGFNIMDPEQRAEAFGEGYEKFFSGFGDFGVQMASPGMASAIVLKAAQRGALGVAKGGRDAAHAFETAGAGAFDELVTVITADGSTPRTFAEFTVTTVQQADRAEQLVRRRIERQDVAQRYEVPQTPDLADPFWDEMDSFGLLRGKEKQDAINTYTTGKQLDEVTLPERVADLPINDQEAIRFSRYMDDSFGAWQSRRLIAAAEEAGDEVPAFLRGDTMVFRKSSDEIEAETGKKLSPLARLYNDILQTDEAGAKVLTRKELEKRIEFRSNPHKAAITSLLHGIRDPFVLTLVMQSLHGSNAARRTLETLKPAISDDLWNLHANVARERAYMEPSKMAASIKSLEESKAALEQQRRLLNDETRAQRQMGSVTGPDGKPIPVYNHEVLTDKRVLEQYANLDASIDQIDMLIRYMNGENIDLMAPGPFYRADHAERVMHSLYQDMDNITLALQKDLKNAMLVSNPDYRPIVGIRAIAGTTPGTKLAEALHADRPAYALADWYARQVGKRRERSAKARYEYSMEGAGIIPRRVITAVRTVDENGNPIKPVIDRRIDWGWISGSSYGNRFRRASRAWMWFGTETPAGYVGLKGSALLGSENELAAALDLDMYKGDGITVTYKKPDGTVVTEVVGGEARKRELQSMWARTILDPNADPKSTMVAIERLMGDDMAKAYGIRGVKKDDVDAFDLFMEKADKYRAKQLDYARATGTFIDPDTREVHHVPYLKQQLANGHYMHNWHQLETNLQRHALKSYGARASGPVRSFETGLGTAGDMVVNLDNIFQSFWRPAVLFRMSYTQRNVFEGMTRAIAYYGSLAPVMWPAVATYNGLSNRVRKTIANNTSKSFTKNVADTQVYKDKRYELTEASMEHTALVTAPLWQPDDAQWAQMLKNGELRMMDDAQMPERPMRWVFGRDENGPYARMVDPADYDDMVIASHERMNTIRQSLEPLEDELDRFAKGRFGKWREKNIENLREQVCSANAIIGSLRVMGDNWMEIPGYLDAMRMKAVAQADLDTLRFDPSGAITMWRGQALRKKRIGSGTSLGPDGGTYGNAFSDEFENINANLLSSDTARKMSLSSANDAYTSIFRSQFVKEHTPIPFDPYNVDAWAKGMAEVMESNAWNPLVRVLLDNDLNPEAAVEWMLRTPEGRDFAIFQRWLEGTDFEVGELTRYGDAGDMPGMTVYAQQAYAETRKYVGKEKVSRGDDIPDNQFQTVETRLKKTADRLRDPLTGRYEMIDHVDGVQTYAYMVANTLREQMQSSPVFMELARTRARRVAEGDPTPITQADIEDALHTLTPEERANLGHVMGSIEIDSGTSGIMEAWRKTVDFMFKYIGTLPEDAAVRGPFYNKRFKQVRDMLIENYWAQTDPSMLKRGWRKGVTSKGGKVDPDGITHPAFKIPADEMEDIFRTAHKQALYDTREYLYTIERRTKLGKYGEHIWPFISAQQNTLTAGGKILYKNPWVGVAAAKLWAAPERMGWTDEDGNMSYPIMLDWLNERLKDAVDVPVVGGILSGSSMLTIPQNGLNVWAPDTGFFGVIPRPGALAQITASNLMQIGAFPVDTPDAFKSMLGDDADGAYQLLKDYMFGDQGSLSTKTGSWDLVLPPWVKRILDSKDELSSAYGYYFQLEWADQIARAMKGDREDWPNPDEIDKRVTNKFWFYALGNFGAFGMTRPDIQKPLVTELQSILQMYLDAQGKRGANGEYLIEPGQAYMAFNRDFGQDLLPLAMKGTSKNVGGADTTTATVGEIRAYDTLIRELAPSLGDDLPILDILINNASGPSDDYSDEALRWQRVSLIPGTGEEWRQPLSGREAIVQTNTNAGWVEYRKFVDQQEAKMHSMGLRNMQQSAAAPLREQKDIFLINMSKSNPDWYADYSDGSTKRLPKVINLLSKMVTDPTVQDRMMTGGQESLYGAMSEYLYYRQQTVMALEESGKGINDLDNAHIKDAWGAIRQRLKDSDVRWSEIATRWLDTDDNPQYAGEPLLDPMALAQVDGM